MTRETVPIHEAELFELLTVASLFLVALFGAIIAYQAYRGYRRNDSPPMFYLSLGLLCLTVVPFLLNVALNSTISPDRVVTVFFQNVSRLVGLLAITYSLYGHH